MIMALFCICVWLWSRVFKRHRSAAYARAQLQSQVTDPVQLKHLELLDQEITYYRAKAKDLRAQRNELNNKIWWYEKKGLLCNNMKKNLEKVEEKLHIAEIKMTKAELAKMKLERKYEK